jgi:3-oxoacyl-[acyl-carrier protein] reductase
MELGLKGKLALVTGASEGIGAGIAESLAAEGVRVAIVARTEAKLRETAERITQRTGTEVVLVAADVRTLAGCQGAVAQAVERLGGLDFLVNNVGAAGFGKFMDLPDEVFVDSINGKLLSCVRFTQAAIPHMKRRGGGGIVNITGATQEVIDNHSPGAICNAGMRLLSKELAIELAPLKIRVNSIAPGPFKTARAGRNNKRRSIERGVSEEALMAQYIATIPLQRWGEPTEIGDAICFLFSEKAGFISGAAIAIDGAKPRVS